MNVPDEREVIPGGKQGTWRHLIPIAKLLIERGHPVVDEEDEDNFGFYHTPSRVQCELGRPFTDDDWAAINERFILPDTIVFVRGSIRDNVNWIDMFGVASFTEGGRILPYEEWEKRERQSGRRL